MIESECWIVDNLNSALNTWNEKLTELWSLLTDGWDGEGWAFQHRWFLDSMVLGHDPKQRPPELDSYYAYRQIIASNGGCLE